ncbi:MAG TPA: mycothiol system anti-sigma-R factor [Acidimicrobiales bacterium]|nr:mycothiol system anti-sigma-R factor [Acidimicrobiales bacterium]
MGTGGSEFDCNETLHTLYTYLDGELTDDRRQEIKRHLDECPPCFEAFDFEAELRVVIAQRCKDHVPDTLRQRVHEALIEEEKKQQSARG